LLKKSKNILSTQIGCVVTSQLCIIKQQKTEIMLQFSQIQNPQKFNDSYQMLPSGLSYINAKKDSNDNNRLSNRFIDKIFP
jgi:hypothetical protein